jgi:hypothetical protein
MPIPIGAEQAAPSWLPIVFLAVPIALMASLLLWGVRLRLRSGAARRAHERRRDVPPPADPAAIDPSDYSTDALLDALAPVGTGDNGDEHYDEGWAGAILGLRAQVSAATEVLEPHVYWGERAGRQVFIRVGPDEKLEGGTTMFSNRHVRSITVVRVDAPSFSITSERGALRASPESPPAVHDLVGALAPDRATWSDMTLTAGPRGLVATRPVAGEVENSWVYDLWLCERIAHVLSLPPLPPARVGPPWKVPYGLGRALSPTSP